MDYLKTKLLKALIEHFGDDDRRIEHALRVTAWAEKILETESGDRDIALIVGLLHDVGIKEAEASHNSSSGKLQEKFGPPIVHWMLEQIGLPQNIITEACDIVGKHHTSEGISSPNFSILWDADMLVNLRDDLGNAPPDKIEQIIEKSLKTSTGKFLARKEFLE